MKKQRCAGSSVPSRRISVRWKLIYYGLIISCIPAIFLSLYFVNDIRNSNAEAEQARYANVAANVSDAFFHDVQSMQTVAILMTTETRLSDRMMDVSVYNDLQTMKMLRSFKNMLPLAADCGLYTQKTPEVVYCSEAIWKRSLFTRYVFTDEKLFEEVMQCPEKVNFTPWSAQDNACICTIPMGFDEQGVPSRIVFFELSVNAILNRFDMFMDSLEDCSLAAIWDDDGKLIFYNSACGIDRDMVADMRTAEEKTGMHNDLYFCMGESSNYSVLICGPYSEYYAHIHSFSTSMKLVLLIDLLLCIVLTASFAYVNYRPLAQLVSSIGVHPEGAKGGYEYDAIRDKYASGERQMRQLASQYAESERLLFSNAAEKLMNGYDLNAFEQQLLNDRFYQQGGYYFAAIVPLPADQEQLAPSSIETPLGLIYPVEMCADGFQVYLCWIANQNDYYAVSQMLLERTRHSLSVGTMGESIEHIHTSYLEALLSFNRGGKNNLAFFEKICVQEENICFDNKSLSIMQLVRLLKAGDEAALDELNLIFDSVILGEGSSSYKKYQCFRLIEKLKENMSKLDIQINDETAAQFMNAANPELMRQNCIRHLTAVLEEIRLATTEQNKNTADIIMQFIEEYMDNSALNLSMVAEYAHVSEVHANKVLKEATGQNLQEYLRKRRLETAKELLLCSGEPIAKIAEDVGFNSCSYFIRVFKAEEGVTPSAFRMLNSDLDSNSGRT